MNTENTPENSDAAGGRLDRLVSCVSHGEWVSSLPKKPGKYLFYGNLWGEDENDHHIVVVRSAAQAVCEGHFWFDYKPQGQFSEIFELPKPLFT